MRNCGKRGHIFGELNRDSIAFALAGWLAGYFFDAHDAAAACQARKWKLACL
jgi:hypothetical protein